MKKEKSKKVLNPLFTFVLGAVITTGTVFAASLINSSDVGFTSQKGLKSNNVQAAIDEVYAETVDYSSLKSGFDYYTFEGTGTRVEFIRTGNITTMNVQMRSIAKDSTAMSKGYITQLEFDIPNDWVESRYKVDGTQYWGLTNATKPFLPIDDTEHSYKQEPTGDDIESIFEDGIPNSYINASGTQVNYKIEYNLYLDLNNRKMYIYIDVPTEQLYDESFKNSFYISEAIVQFKYRNGLINPQIIWNN